MQKSESRRRTRNDYKRKRVPFSELTLDWAKTNICLTDRKKRIINILAVRPLLTIDQLEYFHPNFGHQKQSRVLLRRDLNKLHEVYFIDKATKKPIMSWNGTVKKTQVIAMGELGSQYVGWATHHKRIKYNNGEVLLPKTAHHILRIHDMEIQTREFLRPLDVEVKVWVHECGQRVINHRNELNPDVFCMFHDHQTNKYYTSFIEYDTGKADFGRKKKFPSLILKFNRYKEIKDWGVWYQKAISRESENKFPHLFFVTEDPKRFPEVPNILDQKELESTTCLQKDYLDSLNEFIQKMRN